MHSICHFLLFLLLPSVAQGFVVQLVRPLERTSALSTTLRAVPAPENDNNKPPNPASQRNALTRRTNTDSSSKRPKKKGYQFGDFTKSLIEKGVHSVTGKDEYQFGDASKWLGEQVSNYTGKEDYQFGDLSHTWLANYTGKTGSGEHYEFGDISKAIFRRVESGEYAAEDVFLALRILLAAGLTAFLPVATALPIRWLLSLINWGLVEEVSGRVTLALAEALDRRMKQALTGNAQYMLGDITKERLEAGLTKFTGKETYQVGDITKTIQQQMEKQQKQQQPLKSSAKNQIVLSSGVLSALEQWDPKKKK